MIEVTIPIDLDDCAAAISVWLYRDGDVVGAGDVIAELMIDKASIELRAPATGMLKIVVPVEGSVANGQIVAHITP